MRGEELLLGKAAAGRRALRMTVAYAIYFVFLVVIYFGATAAVSSAVLQGPQVTAQVLFTPLIALWAIWVGIAMSVRARDIRVAQRWRRS